MRFLELASLSAVHDEIGAVPAQFHRTMTVIGPLDLPARDAWIDRLLASLDGSLVEDMTITFVDGTGRALRLEHRPGAPRLSDLESGEDITDQARSGDRIDLLQMLELDRDEIARLAVIRPAEIAASVPACETEVLPDELLEARHLLAQVEAQHDLAVEANAQVEEIRDRLAVLERELGRADEYRAHKKYVAAQVERSRLLAELAVLRGEDPVDEDALRRCEAVLDQLDVVDAHAQRVAERRTGFGNRRRLSREALEHSLTLSTEVPPELPGLHEQYLEARIRRAELLERLDDSAANDLPSPTEPWVLSLSRVNQLDLWERADRAIETRRRVNQMSVALGGAGRHADLVAEIESAHDTVDRAERSLQGIGRRPVLLALGGGVVSGAIALVAPLAAVPLVGAALWAELRVLRARRRLVSAERVETTALEQAGFTSWLGFKLRWVETLIDVNARETLQVAELEDQLASTAWDELAGNITPEQALAKREEIGRYSEHLNKLRTSTDASDALRRELLEEVEPAFERAERALLEVCAPFGVDPEHALSEVAALVFEARSARLQLELEVAEREEEFAVADVVRLLTEAGEAPSDDLVDVDARLAAVELRYQQIMAAVDARDTTIGSGRAISEVEVDLARIEQILQRFELAGIDQAFVEGPSDSRDPRDIKAEFEHLSAELVLAEREAPDLTASNDRLDGLRRRVHMMEVGTGEAYPIPEPKELEMYLLGRIASARRVGPIGEPVPVLVDDILRSMPLHQKCRMLDLLARLGDAAQVIYLTADEETLTWARDRMAHGTTGLLDLGPKGALTGDGEASANGARDNGHQPSVAGSVDGARLPGQDPTTPAGDLIASA
jgi:hypothetical protein